MVLVTFRGVCGVARFLMARGVERNEAWKLGGIGKNGGAGHGHRKSTDSADETFFMGRGVQQPAA